MRHQAITPHEKKGYETESEAKKNGYGTPSPRKSWTTVHHTPNAKGIQEGIRINFRV
jgi:hypothetical protein